MASKSHDKRKTNIVTIYQVIISNVSWRGHKQIEIDEIIDSAHIKGVNYLPEQMILDVKVAQQESAQKLFEHLNGANLGGNQL